MPVRPEEVDAFDPAKVPTVGDLLNELGQVPPSDSEDQKGRKTEGKLLLFTRRTVV